MRRLWCALLAVAMLLVCVGCENPPQETGIRFYYLTAEPEIGDSTSLFASELRQTDNSRSWAERVQIYLTGPVDENLRNPFPKDVRVTEAILRETEKEICVTVSDEYAGLTGVARAVANACLVLTLTEHEEIEQVQLYCENGEPLMGEASSLTRDMFLSVPSAAKRELTCRLYFADEQNRYLISSVRKVVPSEGDSLGDYILHQLLDGPGSGEEGLGPTIPKGTRLLGFTVENGLARVNLSEEFVTNQPKTELGERMTIYSLVNSLTELDTIDRVQILVEGQTLEYYRYMLLAEPLVRWEAVIGPVRSGINEFDATLYYKSWSNEYLAAAPTRIVRDDTRNMGELIVRALLESQPVNGLQNLMPEGTELLSAENIEGTCYVDLSAPFAQITGGYSVERLTVNALVASLCSIESIQSVVLTIEGGSLSLPTYDISQPITPVSSWFFPS